MTRARGSSGELALVLHTHMPYVEGYGTWPFGEEWLWEALATSYLPLLDLLAGRSEQRLTISLTPVLCDQLETLSGPAGERFLGFLSDVREVSHQRDIEGLERGGEPGLAAELERAAGDYRLAAERFEAHGRDLLAAFQPYAAWTSAATHAVLPLCATDAGVRAQVCCGIAAHRRRFGARWRGGFWLPECAHAPFLDPLLRAAGVSATCVDLTDVLGLGADANLTPLRAQGGPLLVPIDRATIELVWSDDGYPANGAYRDYHHHTIHHHRPWANSSEPYDHAAALALAREHASDFVERVRRRLDQAATRRGGPGLLVCALDTELLGHWWYEGTAWLEGVLDEADDQGLELVALDDALARHEPAPAPAELPVTTWGTPRDLSTWDGPAIAELVWRARAAELDLIAAGREVGARALRELLALQSSDWAFMITHDLAAPYGIERADGHSAALRSALAQLDSGPDGGPRNLAPDCSPALLMTP
ncbi:MAG TPA: 1,4-alpha-glucan branching protein domain-containing protein [Solirubrobacteraceae bacterium]|nr:1,4-alpha-glucan branching protein domain-containing protein [Solirubrobacteraceae bacterium]